MLRSADSLRRFCNNKEQRTTAAARVVSSDSAMAGTALLCAIVLLCAAKVQGSVGYYYKKDAGGGAQAVDGIYDGRFVPDSIGIGVQAVFDQAGIRGNVLFTQAKPSAPVQIHVNLMGLDQSQSDYRWSVHEYPVRTSLIRDFPCAEDKLGGVFAGNDLSTRLGNLLYDMPWQIFEDSTIELDGPNSIVGRSLVIDRGDGPEGGFVCSNIEHLGSRREILRATFDNSIIQGDVVFRYTIGRDDALIEADITYVNDTFNSAGNTWTLHFPSPGGDPCSSIEEVYGAAEFKETIFRDCGPAKQRECIAGDLTSKCGALEFVNGRARNVCTDNQIGSTPREYLFDSRTPEHGLVVVIRDANGNVLGCAPLEMVAPLQGRAQFRTLTAFGDFLFWQNGPDDRTYVRTHVTGLRGMDFAVRVFENAPMGMMHPCDQDELGAVWSKPGGEFFQPGGGGAIGNLDDLLVLEEDQQSLRTTVSTAFLPLFGPYSILDRGLGFVNNEGEVVACAPIMRQEEYPPGEFASLLGFQDQNNPPLPEVVIPTLPTP